MLPHLLTTLGLLGGCEPLGPVHIYSEDAVAPEPVGRLEISEDSLDFGDAAIGGGPPELRWLSVGNTGDGPLTILGLDEVIGDGEAFSVSGAGAVIELDPGEQIALAVQFVPPSYGDYQGVLVADESHRVDLWGHGSAPMLALSTEALRFPETPVGCESRAVASIRNDGDDLLLLDALSLSSGSPDISLLSEGEAILGPGEQLELELAFAPSSAGDHTAALGISSNDPAEPLRSVQLAGEATWSGATEERFDYLPRAAADVLFVVDSSPSVFGRLSGAAQGAPLYFESLDRLGVDWRYTVSTAEQDCYATAEPWIDSGSDSDASGELLAAFSLVDEGDSRLLERTAELLERTDPGDCLAGFLRPNSQLHVILITDRQESSPDTVAHYLRVFEAQIAKSVSSSTLTVSAVVGDGGICPAAAAALDAAERTGGVLGDLCQASWQGLYPLLAQASAATDRTPYSYRLGGEPVPSTIELTAADGRPLEGWSYDAASTSVLISGAGSGVAIGESITVRYLPATECP